MTILVSWLVWLERNNRTFDRQQRTVPQLLGAIVDEASVWVQAGYKQLAKLLVALGHAL